MLKQDLRGKSLLLLLALVCSSADAAETTLELTTFRADVTPPLGEGPCVGAMPKVTSIEHPLELRGVILRADSGIYVLSTIDYCGICNSSDEVIRDAIAHAAGTTRDRVALQSLHQHTAPILDAEAVRLLYGEGSDQLATHLRFTESIAKRSADAIRDAQTKWKRVTRIVGSQAKVDRVASNRRVPQPDGTIAVRSSLTRDLEIRNAAEGLIDPWLRTVTFFSADKPVAQLHYYATHPQSFYGDGRISWDTVGMARNKLEKQTSVFQVYFTGCAGNVTLGKYNAGTNESRAEIADRLHAAMRKSYQIVIEKTRWPETADAFLTTDVDLGELPKGSIVWSTEPLKFTVREDGRFHPKLLEQQLISEQPFQTRLRAAMYAGFAQRLRAGYVANASRLRIGSLDILHLPGEPFVEFQLFAQEHARAGAFTCVAGYGECGVWYYGPDQIYRDRGGYEQTWSLTGPCEHDVKRALSELLQPVRPASESP